MPDTYDPELAKQYDKHAFMWRLYVPVLRDLLAEYDSPSVLDLGCGTGSLLLELGGEYSYGLGIDLSPSMIKIANSKLQAGTANSTQFRVADIRAFTPSRTFAICSCTDGVLPYLHDTSELEDVLSIVADVITPDGTAIIEIWTPAANPPVRAPSNPVLDDFANLPDEILEGGFEYEVAEVHEAGFSRHRFYSADRQYSYTIMRHGDREALHRHLFLDPTRDLVPLLHDHRLRIKRELGISSKLGVPALGPYTAESPIWSAIVCH